MVSDSGGEGMKHAIDDVENEQENDGKEHVMVNDSGGEE